MRTERPADFAGLAGFAEREARVRVLFAQTGMSARTITAFQRLVHWFYRRHGRALPWRATRDPYAVCVSEVMLQQTQVGRVAEKFPAFLAAFPDFAALAKAPLRDVFRLWHGLGYNRRALALKRAAVAVVTQHAGTLPRTTEALDALPGIGPATAASIAAFAFNKQTVFLETNIRAVLIHFFVPASSRRRPASDQALHSLAAQTLDKKRPCDWYNALMDLGTHLKATHGNLTAHSAGYRKQSRFHGSRRQVRGRILKHLLGHGSCSTSRLATQLDLPKQSVGSVLEMLLAEGLVRRDGKARFTL